MVAVKGPATNPRIVPTGSEGGSGFVLDVTPANGLVLAVGEVLWDLLPDGPMLGGAPLNLAVHLRRLDRPSAILTAVGADEPGRQARREIESQGVEAAWVQTSSRHPTGTALVELKGASPTFEIARPAAYDDLGMDPETLSGIVRASPPAIAIGTLAQQSPQTRAVTVAVLGACPNAIRFYDANLRDGWDGNLVDDLLESSTVIKLNEDEARDIANLLGLSARDPREFIGDLANQTGARAVCMTRGAEGAVLLLDGQVVEGLPPAVTPVDTVGAGDAFAAALLDGILSEDDPGSILRRALALGALVATRRGATPDWHAAELEAILKATPTPT